MKVFVTGATGFIGFAVAAELARAGHSVYGLARSAEKATRLTAAEVIPVIGGMDKPETFLDRARESGVLIHCAAEYSARYMDLDRRTVLALLEAAQQARRPRLFIYTSGCWVYGNTASHAVDETSHLNPPGLVVPRIETEELILGQTNNLVRTIILRPGCVYGGSGSLTAAWFDSARNEGAARMVGDGANRWTMVHISDLAVAYRLAAESHYAREIFNISDRSRFTVLECAKAASHAVNGKAATIATPVAEAAKKFGPMAECLALDQHIDASKALRLLGWNPRHGGFVDGVERYHESWKSSH